MLSRDLIKFIRHGKEIGPKIFDADGFVKIEDLMREPAVKNLFSKCNLSEDAIYDGISYVGMKKGLYSATDKAYYELSEDKEKIRSVPEEPEPPLYENGNHPKSIHCKHPN